MKLDGKDARILSILKENARESNTQIAKKLKLSEGAVRQRIKNLVESGAIKKFTIESGEGKENSAVIMVNAKKDSKRMMKDIAKLKVARTAYEISGAFDACVVVEGETVEEIDNKLDKIRDLKTVSETRTFIVLRKW